MKKTSMSLFTFAMLVALSAANAAPPPWDGCSFQNFTVDFGTYEDFGPHYGYDYCASLKVAGTLKGRLISCGMFADYGVSSEDVFDNDDTRAFTAKWFDIFETEGGTISGTELGWLEEGSTYYMESGMFIIEGGTGKYQGVTGNFTFSPDWPSKGTTGIQGSGYVCPAK